MKPHRCTIASNSTVANQNFGKWPRTEQWQRIRDEKEDVMKKVFRNFALTVALGLATLPAAAANHTQRLSPLETQVRHELVTMPYYSLFDNLVFKVDGTKVTLSGQTIRPTIKNSAERLVARLEGVVNVENEIEVLPVSSYDDRLRLRLARAIYTNPVLDRLGLRSVPSIHIIVRNGNVKRQRDARRRSRQRSSEECRFALGSERSEWRLCGDQQPARRKFKERMTRVPRRRRTRRNFGPDGPRKRGCLGFFYF